MLTMRINVLESEDRCFAVFFSFHSFEKISRKSFIDFPFSPSKYGADPFALNSNGCTPLQCAQGDCIQVLQTLTNNHSDFSMQNNQTKSTTLPSQNNTLPRQKPPAATTSPAPPYDKLPSTVI